MAMRLDFTLDRQVITRTDSNRVVAGSKGYVTAHFTDVSGDWHEPVTAIFGSYVVILEDMGCTVPWEALADPGAFEVSAFCGDLHTANTVRVDVEASGYKQGETPADPTPDVYSQLMETVEESKRIAQSVRDDADAGKFDGEDGVPGIPGKPGDKGDPGTPGRDGTSPTANVQQTAEGATISITDVNGTTTATIRNGAPGAPGDKGDPGLGVPDGGEPGQTIVRTEDGAKWADLTTGNVLVGTASGTVARAEDAYSAKPREVRIEGAGAQPEKLVTAGKNLMPAYSQGFSDHGVTVTPNGDGSYTFDGTASGTMFKAIGVTKPPDGEYTASINGFVDGFSINIFGAWLSSASPAKVVVSDSTSANIVFKADSGTVFDETVIGFQLEIGSTATEYEPTRVTETALPDGIDLADGDVLSIAQDGTAQVEHATGEPTPLGTVDLPKLPAPTFNLHTTGGDVQPTTEVDYERDVNIVIGKLETAVAVNTVEIATK